MTPLDLLALAIRIENAEREASRGCGLSDVLFEKRVQAAYAGLLEAAPAAHRAETEAALRSRGFDPDFQPYQAGEGECSITGIDVNCCPCVDILAGMNADDSYGATHGQAHG